MCDCKNVEIGSYANQVEMSPPWGGVICVDECLKEEIAFLWRCGVKTTGCCCGHNKTRPMINVTEKHHQKMIDLGYGFYMNQFFTVCYIPKSVK